MKTDSITNLEHVFCGAEKSVREFPECLWWWNQEFNPSSREDIEEIIRVLRTNGGHRAWARAQELHQCL